MLESFFPGKILATWSAARVLIKLTHPTVNRKLASKWARALDHALALKILPKRLREDMKQHGGIAGLAKSGAKQRRERFESAHRVCRDDCDWGADELATPRLIRPSIKLAGRRRNSISLSKLDTRSGLRRRATPGCPKFLDTAQITHALIQKRRRLRRLAARTRGWRKHRQ